MSSLSGGVFHAHPPPCLASSLSLATGGSTCGSAYQMTCTTTPRYAFRSLACGTSNDLPLRRCRDHPNPMPSHFPPPLQRDLRDIGASEDIIPTCSLNEVDYKKESLEDFEVCRPSPTSGVNRPSVTLSLDACSFDPHPLHPCVLCCPSRGCSS